MRRLVSWLAFLFAFTGLVDLARAQTPETAPQGKPADPNYGPTDAKAKKTYDEALEFMKTGRESFALEGFLKADKQDGGKCVLCEVKAWNASMDLGDFKAARQESAALLDHLDSAAGKAQAQFLLGQAWLAEGMASKHDKPLEAADAAFQAALQLRPNYPDCLYEDGTALAYLKRDDNARARFQDFLKIAGQDDLNYARAQRFIARPELARARVAPNFRLTTLDGKTLTLESLAGKVVLIDFWATWCGPCREALPNIRKIAAKFDGQPLVVLSISLDDDAARWKEFVGKNGMTWMQYRDGGFDGSISKQFNVTAIPATFTIDADGVLEDQHVGDADIEGKLKKLVARAAEVANRKPAPAAADMPASSATNAAGPL
jgi:thiol-disulfide isomerase/thioredoxin